MQRRDFIKTSVAAALVGSIGGLLNRSVSAAPTEQWRMPDEANPHSGTWMAYGATEDVWGTRLMRVAQDNLLNIATAIAAYEPVQMLVRPHEYDQLSKKVSPNIKLLAKEIDDLWMRDTGPVFVRSNSGALGAVNFNFNGWGNKQEHDNDRLIAEFVGNKTGANVLHTRLILEGGGIEVDGEGTAIITESCVLNPNRNPNLSKAQCESELKRLLGLEKIIWLPGIAGRDITDGHTDFYARFTSPGVVVAGLDNDSNSEEYYVTRRHLAILKRATDAKGRPLEIMTLTTPKTVRSKYETKEFAAGYINFYACNGAVLSPEFGDRKTDRDTRDKLRDLFPKREIIQLNIDGIAAGGGGIHCTAQQQPASA